MRRSSFLVFGLGLLGILALPLMAQRENIKESALRQMAFLAEEKANRTPVQQKIASSLLHTLAFRHDPMFRANLPDYQTGVETRANDMVTVDLKTRVTPRVLDQITDLGGEVINAHARFEAVRAELPLEALEQLASLSEVRAIHPAEQFMTRVTTEGDTSHGANVVRSSFGVDGTGITVGVISDSVEELANLQAINELPDDATVLPGQAGTGLSEGTALMEIIHDMAPGADLIFATAAGGEAQLAQNILDLFAAGCTVIVDDVFYFSEGVYQDDVIAQAVEEVFSQGAIYFSAAGNAGNLNSGNSGTWEGDYSGIAAPPVLAGTYATAHDFGGGVTGNEITFDSPFFFTLSWANPLGGATDDYDLFVLDDTLANVVTGSTNMQTGTQDPFEIIDSQARDDTDNRLVVVKFSGDDVTFHLATHRGRLAIGTEGQIYGHPAAENAIAVAAVRARLDGSAFVGGALDSVEEFSSDGPRRIFFNPDGSPVVTRGASTSVVRQKPEVAAANGVMTATPGFDPFFGTSASAPHSAAISALFAELFPTIPNYDAFDIFISSALDIEDPGFDRDSGNGIMMTEPTFDTPIFVDGFESGDTSAWTK